jgi:hypothetical protein
MSTTVASGGRVALNFELQGALEVSRALGAAARNLPKIQQRAIGTLRRRLPVQARRDIQAEYALAAARINKDLGVGNIAGGLRLTGYFRGIGLRNFAARQTRPGVTASVFRGQRTLREGTFMAPLLNGGVQVVRREGEPRLMTKGRYAGKKRQPLVVEYGPSVAQMLRKGRRPERLVDFARGLLSNEVDRQLASLARAQVAAATATGDLA